MLQVEYNGKGHSNINGTVHTWYQFSTLMLLLHSPLGQERKQSVNGSVTVKLKFFNLKIVTVDSLANNPGKI